MNPVSDHSFASADGRSGRAKLSMILMRQRHRSQAGEASYSLSQSRKNEVAVFGSFSRPGNVSSFTTAEAAPSFLADLSERKRNPLFNWGIDFCSGSILQRNREVDAAHTTGISLKSMVLDNEVPSGLPPEPKVVRTPSLKVLPIQLKENVSIASCLSLSVEHAPPDGTSSKLGKNIAGDGVTEAAGGTTLPGPAYVSAPPNVNANVVVRDENAGQSAGSCAQAATRRSPRCNGPTSLKEKEPSEGEGVDSLSSACQQSSIPTPEPKAAPGAASSISGAEAFTAAVVQRKKEALADFAKDMGGSDVYPELQMAEFEARYDVELMEDKFWRKLMSKEVSLYLWRARCARRNVTTDYINKYNLPNFNEMEKKLMQRAFVSREKHLVVQHEASLNQLATEVPPPSGTGDLHFPAIVRTTYNYRPSNAPRVWPAAPWREVDEEIERRLTIINHLEKKNPSRQDGVYKYFPGFL